MKRREFIGIAAAGAAGVVLPVTVRSAESLAATITRPRLIGILGGEECAREIGRCYRAMAPHEDDTATLTRGILGSLTVERPAATLRARLDEQVRRDFAEEQTVTLEGWIVSVTEARQCALLSLRPA